MSRDTYKDFRLIREVKQLLTETGMVGKSYFNHRKRKVSKISAGGRIRKNNQALSYLRRSILGATLLFSFCNTSVSSKTDKSINLPTGTYETLC